MRPHHQEMSRHGGDAHSNPQPGPHAGCSGHPPLPDSPRQPQRLHGVPASELMKSGITLRPGVEAVPELRRLRTTARRKRLPLPASTATLTSPSVIRPIPQPLSRPATARAPALATHSVQLPTSSIIPLLRLMVPNCPRDRTAVILLRLYILHPQSNSLLLPALLMHQPVNRRRDLRVP